ncbi:MAG: 3-deoxy-7-phosphoheptulonate synthase [Opitutales bacterium]
MHKVSDINVSRTVELPRPHDFLEAIPKTDAMADTVAETRETIHRIIFGDDKRLLAIVGPCSIHDVDAGLAYAEKFRALAGELDDRLFLVMRAYFEKPRTTVGWKGLIMDPQLDGSYDIPEGLRVARTFLRDLIQMGVPTATELLDPITPQYIADLICWTAIGARTAESQTHRQMASGLSMPIGIKNATDGNVQIAINAIRAASQPQTFMGISGNGVASAVTTRGNPNCHVILRGGTSGPNFDSAAIAACRERLTREGLIPAIMIDCAHANSGKDPQKQPEVLKSLVDQAAGGDLSIIGTMLESNLKGGSQAFPLPREDLVYGQSITDPCLAWETTEATLREAYERLAPRFT